MMPVSIETPSPRRSTVAPSIRLLRSHANSVAASVNAAPSAYSMRTRFCVMTVNRALPSTICDCAAEQIIAENDRTAAAIASRNAFMDQVVYLMHNRSPMSIETLPDIASAASLPRPVAWIYGVGKFIGRSNEDCAIDWFDFRHRTACRLLEL